MKQLNLILCSLFFAAFLTTLGCVQWKESNQMPRTISMESEVSSASDFLPSFDFLPGFKSSADKFEFAYNVGTRFIANITKENLQKAKVVSDIIPVRNKETVQSYHNIELNTFEEGRNHEIKTTGESEFLNAEQKHLLQSMDYTSDFYITGSVKRRNGTNDALLTDTLVLYLSVVPENPATYSEGINGLVAYLKEYSKQDIGIALKEQVKAGKISFIVTKTGGLGEVKLTSTSGYQSIDDKMISLIKHMPGSWEAASNEAGQNVNQELVFSFGLIGC